jgi:hypothetical protein
MTYTSLLNAVLGSVYCENHKKSLGIRHTFSQFRPVSWQQLGKHVPAAKVTHATRMNGAVYAIRVKEVDSWQ